MQNNKVAPLRMRFDEIIDGLSIPAVHGVSVLDHIFHSMSTRRATTDPFLFSGADFALIPSRDEPFGLVAVEFGQKGALGVASRLGGLGLMPGYVDSTLHCQLNTNVYSC